MRPLAVHVASVLGLLCAGCARTPKWMGGDPLPSWNEGASKEAIIDFVARATTPGSPDYVMRDDRIAVFDNDGTLWCEQPMYFQFLFAMDRIRAMAPQHPQWRTTEPYRSVLEGNMQGVMAAGEKGLLEIVMATHAGMTTEEFSGIVRDWMKTARHPKYNRPYNQCVYLPMLEVLEYLRSKGFKTFIVSGGGTEFMRPWVQGTYGIPPEQVVGSRGKLKFEMQDGRPALVKLAEVDHIDDGPGKPVGIQQMIGRRSIMAFGNSDGDLQMFQYTTTGPGAGFALIVHHTDNEREVAYDRSSHIGKLDKAWDEAKLKGWTVVDMKNDWKSIFPDR